MSRHRHASTFIASLPIAGVDGTLRDRLKACQKRLWAKTGTKEHTSALAGYAVGRNNERLVFSVILNNYKDDLGNQTPRAESDALVQLLMEL